MKIMISIALACLPAFAHATEEKAATLNFTPQLADNCLKGYAAKNGAPATLAGQLSYNEPISLAVADQLFWKHGNSGVAFTAPLWTNDEKQATLACYYSRTASGLAFDFAQAIPKAL